MYLIIDNYDSFTYNLYQAFAAEGASCLVRRNDKISLREIRRLAPDKIIISPGPKTPDVAGISNDIIRVFGKSTPILGICLGHQCIAKVFGGRVSPVPDIIHGRTSRIYHNGASVFKGVSNPFRGARYHSLRTDSIPTSLEVTAKSEDGVVMAVMHREYPVIGLQFHPESFLTEEGRKLIRNFIKM